MKRLTLFVLVIVVFLMATGCGRANNSSQTTSCDHDYYLSDYTAPTATQNGSSRYTCKKCGNTYTEIIPATGASSDQNSDNGSYSRSSTKFNLADLPTYSISEPGLFYVYSTATEVMDIKGYKHENVVYSETYASNDTNQGYVRYELKGKYSTLEGTIYLKDGSGDYVWLEFYDGEDFLYSTEKLNSDNYKVTFTFDISGVNYLTIYPKRVGIASSQLPKCIIWDKITVTK